MDQEQIPRTPQKAGGIPSPEFPFSALHRTMVPSHFNATPANLRTRAVQGRRRYARTRRRSSIPTTSRSLATFSGGGSWAEPFCRRPIGGFLRKESDSGLRLLDSGLLRLVPGLFWFRARVILLPDGPTCPTQRLVIDGPVPTFPHPEPPLLLVFVGVAPSPGELSLYVTHAPSSPGVVTFRWSRAALPHFPLLQARTKHTWWSNLE